MGKGEGREVAPFLIHLSKRCHPPYVPGSVDFQTVNSSPSCGGGFKLVSMTRRMRSRYYLPGVFPHFFSLTSSTRTW